MKKFIVFILTSIYFLSLIGCSYNPPNGYTTGMHSYEEILKFAKSIDENATVSKEYTENDLNFTHREYPAVIHGVECYVADVPILLGNDGIFPGEYPKLYYRIDTNYDCVILQRIVSEKQPEWNLSSDGYDDIIIFITPNRTGELSSEELDIVFQQINEIYSAYICFDVRKDILFGLPSPAETISYGKLCVRLDDHSYLKDFTEKGKTEFIDRYHANWALLDSGLPMLDTISPKNRIPG